MSTVRDCRLCVHAGEVTDVAMVTETPVPCAWRVSPSAHVPPWVTEAQPEVPPDTAERCLCYEEKPK